MSASERTSTTEQILASLGFSDPMEAARQQARMLLLGRLARYEAMIGQLEADCGRSLEELRRRYNAEGSEDFASDDCYVRLQWCRDALDTINAQLDSLARH